MKAWYRTEGGGITSPGMYYFHTDPTRAYDRPDPASQPLAESDSKFDGSFEVVSSLQRVIVECRHAGYLAAFNPYFSDFKQKLVIRLFPGVLVRGRVLRADGEPVRDEIRVALFGLHSKRGPCGIWPTETDAFGQFQVEVAAELVVAKIQMLGWRTVSPERPVAVEDGLTLDVVGRRVPLLKVFDSVTRVPIERFSVLMGPPGSAGHYLRGEFSAPDGVLALLYDTIPDSTYRGPFQIKVWAKDRSEFQREVPDLLMSDDIEAPLGPGEASSLTGLVRRKGSPVSGAAVSLNSGQGHGDWKPEKLAAVASSSTDDRGEFKLSGPSGPYILLVRDQDLVHAVAVRLPSGALVIELGDVAIVKIRVTTSQGKPLEGITVLLQSVESARRWKGTSDGGGVALFEGIAPGDLWLAPGKVYYPGRNEYTNNTAEWSRIHAQPGQTTQADLVISDDPGPAKPLPTRLLVKGHDNLEGWKVFDSVRSEGQAVGPEGQLTIIHREYGFSLLSPWGDRWWVVPPKDAGDKWDVEIDPEGAGYDGVLVDQATGQGIENVLVSATKSPPVWHVTTTTDSKGRFKVRGLGTGTYEFRFSKEGEYGISFEPSIGAAKDPTQLRIALPKSIDQLAFQGIPNRRITGQILDSRTSQPVANTLFSISALLNVPQGTLVAGLKTSTATPDGEGRYGVTAPVAPRYRANFSVNFALPNPQRHTKEWTPSGAGDLTVDFQVP